MNNLKFLEYRKTLFESNSAENVETIFKILAGDEAHYTMLTEACEEIHQMESASDIRNFMLNFVTETVNILSANFGQSGFDLGFYFGFELAAKLGSRELTLSKEEEDVLVNYLTGSLPRGV